MLHYDTVIRQRIKDGHTVCGDHVEFFSFKDSYYFGVFDGIGSGVYANLAAIGSGCRWRTMIREGLSLTETCETIAADMNRARSGQAPFTAFNALMLTRHGNALVYTYEAPKPIIRRAGVIQVMEPRFYTAGYEIIGESKFDVDCGDLVCLISDGVSQAGLGRGYVLGWSEHGAASMLEPLLNEHTPGDAADAILEHCRKISGFRHEDDATALIIQTVEATRLSLFSGPPGTRERDANYVDAFRKASGARVICGSSTSGLFARELHTSVRLLSKGDGLQSPPRYTLEGADLVTEGALVLNQAANLITAGLDTISGDTTPEILTRMLLKADVIDLYEGTAQNEAHQMQLFKQLGIRPRKEALRIIEKALEKRGKMVRHHMF